MEKSFQEVFKHHLAKSYNDPSYFNSVVLGRDHYWSRQNEICDLVVNNKIAAIVSGNGLGKTYVTAGIALWYLYTRPDSIVITTAPTGNQLREVLWSQIRSAYYHSRFPLGGKMVSSPLEKLTVHEGNRWYMLGITTTKEEKLSGHHAQNMMVIADEASGIESEIFSSIGGLNPDKLVMIGNPLRVDGYFYEVCQKAMSGRAQHTGFMQISSLESPDIAMPRSERGMADADWLDKMRDQWGENSTWWVTHILGQFPDSNEDSLIPSAWLNKIATTHVQSGVRRIAVDYAEGVGGDDAVVLVRDDNGVYEIKASNTWTIEKLASVVKEMADQYKVQSNYITYDATGSGSDFNNRLRAIGLFGCRPYKGSLAVAADCGRDKLRSNAGWHLRQRLDPTRMKIDKVNGNKVQPPFYIPPADLEKLRPELQAMSYTQLPNGKVALKSKESLRKILGKSPDRADALIISFAFV